MTDSFAYRFEVYELSSYIFAKKHRNRMEVEFASLVQDLYEDAPIVKSVFDNDLGRVFFGSGGSMEDYVIEMIEKKELSLKRLNRLRKQEALFSMGLDSLSMRERDVIQVYYFDRQNDLGLSEGCFHEVLKTAQEKLCNFIGNERQKGREAAEVKRIENRRKIRDEILSGKIRVG